MAFCIMMDDSSVAHEHLIQPAATRQLVKIFCKGAHPRGNPERLFSGVLFSGVLLSGVMRQANIDISDVPSFLGFGGTLPEGKTQDINR